MIDAGRTRQERHAEIVDFNIEKAARSPDFRTRETAKFQRDQMAKDRALENRLITEARRRTLEERRYRAKIRAELKDVRALHRSETQAMRIMLREDWTTKRSAMTDKHHVERHALSQDHSTLKSRFFRVLDITGRTKRRQDADLEALMTRQKAERGELVSGQQKNRSLHSEAVKSRYADMKREVGAQYRPGLLSMLDRHREAEDDADRERQKRAADREKAEKRFEEMMKSVLRQQKNTAKEHHLKR